MLDSSNGSFKDGVNKLNEEANGLLRCEVIRPEDVGPLTYAAFGGNPEAMMRLSAVIDSAKKIKAFSRKKPAICLCCPRSVRNPFATMALLIAAEGPPTVAIASVVCASCSEGEREPLLARVAEAYQACWPNLRCVEVTHPEGGRA